MNKYLQIIEDPQDKKMCEKIIAFLERFDTALSPIQIENFVLNDIEFPTDYGKFEQAKLELSARFGLLIDAYYSIKEKEIEIKKLQRKRESEKDDLEKELLKLKEERTQLQLVNQKKELKRILKEARIFFQVYEKHPEFQELNAKEKFNLEAEQWAKKTLNMPTVFEERYGENYMKKALGEGAYQKFKELRQKGFGLLPREIFGLKQIEKTKDK